MNSSMASSCRCIASPSCRGVFQLRTLSRGFSASSRSAEDEKPRTITVKAQARLDAGQAVRDLAQRRSGADPAGRHVLPRAPISRGPTKDAQNSQPPSTPRTAWRSIFRSKTEGSPDSPGRPARVENRPARAPRSGTKKPSRRRNDDERSSRFRRDRETAKEEDEEDSAEHDMTPEEHKEYLKSLGHTEKFMIKPAQGPHLDMASMMLRYAPKHFGVTEPVSGEYPALTDDKRRGLLQDIVRQIRKNETYMEKDIDQMAKKLGPLMPKA